MMSHLLHIARPGDQIGDERSALLAQSEANALPLVLVELREERRLHTAEVVGRLHRRRQGAKEAVMKGGGFFVHGRKFKRLF